VASESTELDDLRARAATAGFHVFLRPDRPSGWWVTLRNGADDLETPTEARAATREEAITLADRLFVNQRLTELDRRIRGAGLQPPFWGGGGLHARLATLEQFARDHHLV
jgi:hypothetical protein